VYSSSNSSIATVNSSTGVVTILGAGNVTISATQAENSIYTNASSAFSLMLLVKMRRSVLQMPQSISLQQIAAIHLL